MDNKPTTTEEAVKKIISHDRDIIRVLRREIQHLRPGKLHIKHIGDKRFFYEYANKKERAITKEKERVRSIARYEILKSQIELMEHNCSLLENTIKSMKKEDNVRIAELCGLRNEPEGTYTKEQLQWMTADYDKNPYHPENLRYTTSNGVKVRSKSERIIGNRLEVMRIAYRYEPQMVFGGKTVYPDFMILLPDGRQVIWEHFGLMDDDSYKQNAYNKIELYRRHGFTQHSNFICTWEEDLQNTADIDQIITRFTH